MFWLARPPYLRRGAAIAVLVGAVWIELSPTPTVLHPFARTSLGAGQVLEADDFVMRPIPPDIIPLAEVNGVLTAPLMAGDPLTPSMVGRTPVIPAGWWGLEVPVPAGVTNGSEVRLIVKDGGLPRMVPGMVVRTQEGDGFDGPVALVAIPEGEAATTAAAVNQGDVAVLVGSVAPADGG
ncbi:MAG TPA: SAF domain-containing protein [Acidimicrobiia bacterium]|nr:SAF domain-containing protein [Acidimicrobiia bacterium]